MITILKRKVFFPVLALAIIGAGLMSTNIVSAQTGTGANSLITAIAQKFNLNENDVKAVFEDQRSKRAANLTQKIEDRVTQAVKDGKITEAQKTAILAKLEEMKNNHPDPSTFKNLTPDQKKTQMAQKKAEMDAWLNQNGISQQTFRQLIGFRGMGFGMKGGWKLQ